MPTSDEQLMLEIARGSAPAFELMVHRWERRMLDFLHRCVGDRTEAEDLRQELFLRVYQKRASYRPEGRFTSWLYRIAANLAIDKHARRRKLATQSMDDLDTVQNPPVSNPDRDSRNRAVLGEFEERVFSALQSIPHEERIALVLRHFENLNFKEIAELTDEPESTIKSRVYRGLQSMRAELKRAGIQETDCALIA